MIRRYINWRTILLVMALAIIGGTVLYSRYLSHKIADEEKQRVEEWLFASKLLMATNQTEAINLSQLILSNNDEIPLILTDEKDSIIEAKNIDSLKIKADPTFLQTQLSSIKTIHPPLNWEISRDPMLVYKVYYGNTALFDEVSYYPIIQLLVVALFIITVLALIITQNKSTQNQVWAGLAKETAHQMGTPLTSLQGWIAIMKEKDEKDEIVNEMEKDVERLKLVSDRFGKIGSTAQLVETNLIWQITKMEEYMRRRASGKVHIIFNKPVAGIIAFISPPLFDWVLENLLKNALDAIEGKGTITITVIDNTANTAIEISDTGKGIAPAHLKKIFTPGFTTKKRGWGLGLTLSKRIMQQYHKGELFVKHSELGKGTTFKIVIRK